MTLYNMYIVHLKKIIHLLPKQNESIFNLKLFQISYYRFGSIGVGAYEDHKKVLKQYCAIKVRKEKIPKTFLFQTHPKNIIMLGILFVRVSPNVLYLYGLVIL